MKGNELLRAVGAADDELLAAYLARIPAAPPRRGRLRTGAAAACLCLAALLALLLLPQGAPALPALAIEGLFQGGAGCGGDELWDDPAACGADSPWRDCLGLESLPVYRNASYVPAGLAVAWPGIGEAGMYARLRAAAEALGLEAEAFALTRVGDSAELPGVIPELLPADAPYMLRAEADGVTLAVDSAGSLWVDFHTEVALPGGLRLDAGATDDEARAALDWLAGQYAALLGFEAPRAALETRYAQDGSRGRSLRLYDAAGGAAEDLLRYHLACAECIPGEGGGLRAIRITDGLACAELLGAYPLLTPGEAEARLLAGDFISASAETPADAAAVAAVQLVYAGGVLQPYCLPCYRFLVEQPGEAAQGLRRYAVYYVPAVWLAA